MLILNLIHALCEQGHLALACHQSAEQNIAQIQELYQQLPEHLLKRQNDRIDELIAAQAQFVSGQHDRLFRGSAIDDLPESIRHHYLEDGNDII